jgi:acyl-CoA synthetase (AMP-forming)/AMP-acid ligase II
MSVWSLLDRAYRAHPDSIAVVDPCGARSYADVHRRARGLAAFWRAHGVRAGDRVAILAWNSGAYLESYFAAAALGVVLVPLNARLSARELAEILLDAGALQLVADEDLAEQVRDGLSHGARLEGVIWIRGGSQSTTARTRTSSSDGAAELSRPESVQRDSSIEHASFERAVACDASAFTPARTHPDALAHLYYTSGTTGVPKGVMLTHANVCEHADGAIAELALSERDVWAHIAPMFHLADAWATFAITQVGGRHVFLRRFDAEGALDLLERERTTITNLVPTMLRAMVSHPSMQHVEEARAGVARERTHDWSSLRMMLSGGAPIAPELVRGVIATFGCEYVQTYGMTETSPYLTLGLLAEDLKSLPEEAQLAYKCKTGRAFAKVELQVVDERGEPVPADERSVGEMRVRGPTVTPGYWNRPDETRAAFDDGWLRTGDLAVIDAEGYVTIVDRKKDMIITGGEKVYSIEVENVLYRHPSIREAAVFGAPDEVWGERVCAAVVLRAGETLDPEALRELCRAELAAYKVPRAIELLPELPRTGSGKISKRMLRERGGRTS